MIKLSGYKILKKIGSGGMGDVYLAEHEKLEKKVAIKSLHKNLATDPSFRERFSQEAKTHSKLDHPHIVKLLDYKERKDGLFLIMEYVDGKQLDEHIKKVSGPIPEQELTVLFCQILDAIGYAHSEGLVHRDIKPSNIMIDKKGRIKVLDFGIAKMQEEEKGLTKTGMQIGTAAYMSPEQVNAKKVDKLSDIYSLGVTLFYMAVGKSPYDGETNTFSIQTKIVTTSLPDASTIYPGVSEKFENIISKATEKEKKNRYQSCEEFKNNLQILDLSNVKLNKTKKTEDKPKALKKNKLRLIGSYIFMFLVSFPLIYIYSALLNGDTPKFEEFISLYNVNTLNFTYNDQSYYLIQNVPHILFALMFHLFGLVPVFIFDKLFKNSFSLIDYFYERKRNITLSLLLILFSKVLVHYFVYPERYSSSRRIRNSNYVPGSKKSLGEHFELIFEHQLELFVPVIILFIVFSWIFKSQITKR